MGLMVCCCGCVDGGVGNCWYCDKFVVVLGNFVVGFMV